MATLHSLLKQRHLIHDALELDREVAFVHSRVECFSQLNAFLVDLLVTEALQLECMSAAKLRLRAKALAVEYLNCKPSVLLGRVSCELKYECFFPDWIRSVLC